MPSSQGTQLLSVTLATSCWTRAPNTSAIEAKVLALRCKTGCVTILTGQFAMLCPQCKTRVQSQISCKSRSRCSALQQLASCHCARAFSSSWPVRLTIQGRAEHPYIHVLSPLLFLPCDGDSALPVPFCATAALTALTAVLSIAGTCGVTLVAQDGGLRLPVRRLLDSGGGGRAI